jgi:hypothetical protein
VVIVEERKDPPDTIANLKKIAEIFSSMFTVLNQLERKLAIIEFSEGYLSTEYFGEGSLADKKFVGKKIIELQSLVNELDKVKIVFQLKDIQTSFEQKQSALNDAVHSIPLIRETMLDIWARRDSGETGEDNEKIMKLINKMFKTVNSVIKDIQFYVIQFNKASARKLSFNVKWTPLPK